MVTPHPSKVILTVRVRYAAPQELTNSFRAINTCSHVVRAQGLGERTVATASIPQTVWQPSDQNVVGTSERRGICRDVAKW